MMCVLAVFLDLFPDAPLVVAANRDEFRGRPSAPPAEVEPGIVAGKDLLGGGTWLGVNQEGLFVAVTNRFRPPRAANGLSRGTIAIGALRCRTLDEVERLVHAHTAERPVGGMNLIAVAGREGISLHWDGALRGVRLGRGAHVVSTDWDIDDPRLPERAAFEKRLGAATARPATADLVAFLGSHEGDRPVCKHGPAFGTVSSTIYIAGSEGPSLLHAEGPPCSTPFRPVPLPWRSPA